MISISGVLDNFISTCTRLTVNGAPLLDAGRWRMPLDLLSADTVSVSYTCICTMFIVSAAYEVEFLSVSSSMACALNTLFTFI